MSGRDYMAGTLWAGQNQPLSQTSEKRVGLTAASANQPVIITEIQYGEVTSS